MANINIKYPEIEVQLTGRDGNAFAIFNKVLAALKDADVPVQEIDIFFLEALTKDYDHLLQTCMRWVTVN